MSDEDLWKTIEADASADADAFEDLTTEGATELASMIRNLGAIQTKLVAAEEEAKSLKREQNRYLHDLIPAKMQETGLEEAKVGGNKISLATYVNGTMPKDPLQRDIALSEDNRARAMQADLEDQGFDTAAKTWVEPSTLKKLIKERVETGQEIDLELFNASIGTYAKIKGE